MKNLDFDDNVQDIVHKESSHVPLFDQLVPYRSLLDARGSGYVYTGFEDWANYFDDQNEDHCLAASDLAVEVHFSLVPY